MNFLQPLHKEGLKYRHIIGTGGIGSGIFFSMQGDHTLGRNESRMANLLPYADYCKQHIIMHYIAVLLGAGESDNFSSYPIGKVGNDNVGQSLIQQMKSAGMDTSHIAVSEGDSTLFSVCYQYPDSTGGNITTENSASSKVSSEDILNFFKDFSESGNAEVLLAAPEVPVPARLQLLKYGRERGSLNIAAILSSEVDEFLQSDAFQLIDILSLNIDEARSVAKLQNELSESEKIVERCITKLVAINPEITILITDGAKGSYCGQDGQLFFTPALEVPICSTAGAGDAFLAGLITGLCIGLPLVTKKNDSYFSESPLENAVELGTLLASLSVTSYDTIHLAANAEMLNSFATRNSIIFGPGFQRIFEGFLQRDHQSNN